MKNIEIKIPDKCRYIRVIYEDTLKETFKPVSKVIEYEDCYEFEETDTDSNFPSMVSIMKSEIRSIRFVKDGQ